MNLNYNVRYKEASSITNSDSIYFDNETGILQKISYENLSGAISSISSGNIIFIGSKLDLPTPSSGVITLADTITYFFTTTVDLTGDRLVSGLNTVILGASSENCYIKSTGLSSSTALITSNYSLPIRNISFTHGKVFNLDGDATTTALDWFGINFVNCATVGTIKDYTNFVMTDSAFLNSSGLTFDGTIGTVAFGNCLFDTSSGGTAITLASTLTVSRRFRIIYSSFVTLSGETSLNVSSSATISDERYILDTVNFSGGGTYISGVTQTSNKALFSGCVGITNTAVNGQLYMQGNATATVVSATNTFYKILGTTTASADNAKYTHTNNRLTNDATITRKYLIQCVLSFTSGATHVCEFGFYDSKLGAIRTPSRTKSTANTGGRAENVSFACVVSHSNGDYLEIHCANNTSAQNITVSDMNFLITEIK
jgi:lipopolysaccharide export system protein LptA